MEFRLEGFKAFRLALVLRFLWVYVEGFRTRAWECRVWVLSFGLRVEGL